MDVTTKIALIKKQPTEEVLVEQELKELLETNDHPRHYIGYEVSGFLHIGSLILSGYKINDFIKAGVKCQVYFAHFHSLINNKLGGKWENLVEASKYYDEAFRLFCPGLKTVHATDLYHNNDEFWMNVIKFSKNVNMNRATRCLPIMGRTEKDKLDVASFLYPPMQAVDIRTIGADIAHAGMDQRSAHVLAREIYPKMGWKKPIAVHHHLAPGLGEPEVGGRSKEEKVVASKMSKSKPWTCIFIHDSEDEIRKKIAKAWCPEKTVENNPILDYAKHFVFREKGTLFVERPAKFGGNAEYHSFEELEKAYSLGQLHPADLKNAVSEELNQIIKPLREHFEKHSEFLEVYKSLEITR
ncbi:MAG: tyrosine--tRNA ligase [archaeon]